MGLLALQAAAYDDASAYPFDVLGAQTEGMIGYLIEQELGNRLPFEKSLATVLTMIEVDPADPAFDDPTKFVGPVYTDDEAHRLAARARLGREARRRQLAPGRAVAAAAADLRAPPDRGAARARAASSSAPAAAASPPCTGPAPGPSSASRRSSTRTGPAPSSPATCDADALVIATDTDAVYVDWGTPDQRAIALAHPDDLARLDFPAGSDGTEGRAPRSSSPAAPAGTR